MPDLLLELFSEEIPARMQKRAADDLTKLVTDGLVAAGLLYEGARAFATPRRLALTVHGLPARSPDVREERKGPRVGAPEKAIEGFLRSAGLTSIDQASVQADKKGEVYVAVIEKAGRPAAEVIAEVIAAVIRGFPWPKSMHWGDRSKDADDLAWVRPLHSILCTFGPETEEPEVVVFEVGGVRSGNTTYGHRFMAPEPIIVRRFDDYVPKLEAANVVLDAERRKDIILHGARDQALALGLELVEDDGLADEVSGLVEWPVVLVGAFDESFLKLPPEVIRTTIRTNQKCFVLAKPGEKQLSNRFILVANIEARDGGKEIVAGNERVIRARLSDAEHFWKTDLAPLADYRDKAEKPLDQRLAKLRAQNIVFHEKLGTQGERVERIAFLSRKIAPLVGADPDKAWRAANLAKADLVTEMVGEFPELQGLMGKYYALAQGEDASVAEAIEDHYKPVGPSDRVPTDPVAIAVALADKLDMLVGFWAINETPTGSKDPYALRRAALGMIDLIVRNEKHFPLSDIVKYIHAMHLVHMIFARKLLASEPKTNVIYTIKELQEKLKNSINEAIFDVINFSNDHELFLFEEPVKYYDSPEGGILIVDIEKSAENNQSIPGVSSLLSSLLAFFADRLKVQLREQGARHDLVDAVFALGQGAASSFETRPAGAPQDEAGRDIASPHPEARAERDSKDEGASSAASRGMVQDDLLLIVRRVEALGKFLDSEDGKNLLAGYKRAANILRDEEKKSGGRFDGAVDVDLLSEPEEKALAGAIDIAIPAATKAVEAEDFEAAMIALAGLRPPVDAFFDTVMVNAPEEAIRANRLRLLNKIREATLAVADFSKVGG